MGIWDYFSEKVKPYPTTIRDCVSSSTQKMKPDLHTIWRNVSSVTQKVKPDLTAVKSVCGFAGSKIDNAVREVFVGKVVQYWRDEQARSQLTRFAADFAKNTGAYVIQEGSKTVPGGVFLYKIMTMTLQDGGGMKSEGEKFEDKNKKIEELDARIKMLEKQIHAHTCSCRKFEDQREIPKPESGDATP